MTSRIALLVIAGLAVAATAASADPYFVRTWQAPGTHFQTTFFSQVEVRPGYWGPPRGYGRRLTVAQQTVADRPGIGHGGDRDRDHGQVGPRPDPRPDPNPRPPHPQPNPRPQPPYPQPPQPPPPVWHPPVYRDVRVDLSLDLAGLAPLRYGEQEVFQVQARPVAGQPALAVDLVATESVWTYLGQDRFMVRIDPMGPGYVPIRFQLTPTRRHPIRPPNTVAGLRVGTRGENDPLVLEWEDASRLSVDTAPTLYLFKVARNRFLLPDKTIAEGSVQPPDQAPHQTVTITKGGRFQQFDEYLKDGSKYVVTVQVQKLGSDYTNQPSDATRLDFVFRASQNTYSRDANRAVNFRQLYHHGR